jgi:hypothetical protein
MNGTNENKSKCCYDCCYHNKPKYNVYIWPMSVHSVKWIYPCPFSWIRLVEFKKTMGFEWRSILFLEQDGEGHNHRHHAPATDTTAQGGEDAHLLEDRQEQASRQPAWGARGTSCLGGISSLQIAVWPTAIDVLD